MVEVHVRLVLTARGQGHSHVPLHPRLRRRSPSPFRGGLCCANIGGTLRAMRKFLIALAVLAAPALAEEKPALAPGEIVAAAPKGDWTAIAPSDLLVMDLAADAKDKPRRVVIQLMPAPFSQGWIGNIRRLAAARWWDGLSVNRVQDNYVVQWGDGEAEDKARAKALPVGLAVVPESEYAPNPMDQLAKAAKEPGASIETLKMWQSYKNLCGIDAKAKPPFICNVPGITSDHDTRSYAGAEAISNGWPIATDYAMIWPVHCYGMVGVGRDMP
jgi:peptidylprolyl isomerase